MIAVVKPLLAGIFLYFLSINQSFALSKLGHQLICQMSYEQLAKPHQQQIDRLLGQLSAKHQQSIRQYNHVNKDSKIDFALACTWADAIKKQSQYDGFKSWHYLNIDRNSKEVDSKSCQQDCLPQAIFHHQQQLKSAVNTNDRLEALMFLGHWLGDIHQPLHISYASDLGGNKTQISIDNAKCTNLHWYWDDCLIHYQAPDKQKLYQELQQQLGKLPPAVWQPANVWQWANESFQIATSQHFHYCKFSNDVCLPLEQAVIKLPKSYPQTYNPVLRKQLVLAANRLTSILAASL